MSLVRSTLLALTSRRRLIPLGLFGLMLAAVEGWAAKNWLPAVFTVLMYTAFVTLGPLSWCAFGHSTFGRILHGVAGVTCTLFFGLGMSHVFGLSKTLLTDQTGLVAITGGFWVGGYSVGRDIQLEAALFQAKESAELARREAEHAQLLALRAHFDPHFLFNTLNAIAEWCREAPEVAEQATLKLSSMLRCILEAVSQPTWPLARELALVEDLFALYAVRDPQRFVLRLNVAEPARSLPMPPLLLLTLAENAIKHGPAAGHAGAVELEVSLSSSEEVRLLVKNPGAYRGRRAGGEGLALVERRIAHAYGTRARFLIQAVEASTHAELAIPYTASAA